MGRLNSVEVRPLGVCLSTLTKKLFFSKGTEYEIDFRVLEVAELEYALNYLKLALLFEIQRN